MKHEVLTEFCDLNMGQSPDSKTYNEQGDGMPFYQGNANFGEIHPETRVWCSKPVKVASEGDILISVRAPIGAMNIAAETCCIGRGLAALTPKPNKCSQKYLYYALESKIDVLVSKGTGSTFKAISKKVLAETLIPSYTDEKQKQITDTLSKIDVLITNRKQQIIEMDLLVKSRFIELFGDVTVENYKYKTCKLGDVADVGSSHRVFTKEFVEDGIPFYRGTEISELANGIKPTNPYYISKEHYNRIANDDTRPRIGDLLMPSICNKGQVWMVDTDEPFYYKDGRVLCISPNRKIFNTKYFEYFMRMKTFVEYPKLGSGSTFAEFKISLLKNIGVLVPPIGLQNQFACFVQQVDKSKLAVQQGLQELETLKKSLMQQYFG